MTAMPQLVAAFHCLVGLAAVMVAAAAMYSPDSFGIGALGDIHGQALVEMSLGVAIGAITFTGSVIAFLKLDGRMSGKPIMLPMRHIVNIALGAALIVLIILLVTTESYAVFWLIVLAALALGVLMIIPIGGADMPVVVSMLNSYSGWAAAGTRLHAWQPRADHHRRAGRLVGRDPVLHHVQGHEPLLHLGHPRRLRRRDGGGSRRRHRADGEAGLGRRRRLPDGQCAEGHHRAGLRHGGGAGAACACARWPTSSRPRASK